MIENKKVPEIRFKGFTEDWEQRRWIDTVDISTNMVDPKIGKYNKLLHIGPGNIESFTGQFYDNIKTVEEEQLISGKFHFYPGDIIYGKINPQLAKYVLPDFEGLCSADSYILNSKNGLRQKYLYIILQTQDFYKYSVSVSMRSGIPKINRDELNEYSFYSPAEQEQELIGKIFWHIDNLITLNKRKYENLVNIKKSMLEKMFPKNSFKIPEIRFKGFTEDWEQCKVEELFKITRGYVLSATLTSESKDNNNKYPVYSSQTQNNGLMGYYYDYLYDTAITWTTDGANAGTVRFRPGKFYCTNVCGVLLSDKGFANQMMGEALNNIAKKYVSYVGNPKLMNNVMAEIPLEYPTNINEQNQISCFFQNLDTLITLHQRKLEKLNNIKKSMLDKMFV